MQKYFQTFLYIGQRKKKRTKNNHQQHQLSFCEMYDFEKKRHKQTQKKISMMNIYASFLHIVPLDMKNPLERSNYFDIMISITFYFPIEIFNCLISFANYCGVFDFFNENNFFSHFFEIGKSVYAGIIEKNVAVCF